MKGYYDEFGALKPIMVFMVGAMGFIWIIQITGVVTITVTGQPMIDKLNYEVSLCQSELLLKCDPCPIVKCVGNMSVPIFIVGLFFGFLGGALFTMYFGNKFKEEFQKQLEKVKK